MNTFDKQGNVSGLSFEGGVVSWWAYSYQIDSSGGGELTMEETRKLYEAMKKYFEGGDK